MAETVVVGFDGSDASTRALDRAIADTKKAAGHLVVAVVAPMPLDPLTPLEFGTWGTGPGAADQDALRELAAEGKPPPALEPIVEQAETRTNNAGIEADVLWRMGDPAREIVDIARENNATTIVLGEHHHRLFGALFGEDVPAAVQREANCRIVSVE